VSQSVPPGHPVPHAFVDRHIGPSESEVASMLEVVGAADLDALTAQAVPTAIYDDAPLRLPAAASEQEVLAELRDLAARNTVLVPMIGCGYSGTVTPPVVRRRVLEDPGWYTAYTPYQPEISQGRLEALLNFQTVVADLTGLPTSNASLLDEATAAAEAMAVLRRAHKGAARVFVVDADVFPQTLAVLRTRAEAVGIDIVVADLLTAEGRGRVRPPRAVPRSIGARGRSHRTGFRCGSARNRSRGVG
jgi:glycine dehydrogenase